MTVEVLREAMSRRPFEPFRIRLSSGDVFEIRHPEATLLIRGGLYIGLPNGEDIPERAVYCALLHIAAVETLARA
ncbi:MAG TPA: hypothetical protein VJ783_20455 [Pirellulales bacterium]|nr:hypothetical protein [Pirellulales bacterium]